MFIHISFFNYSLMMFTQSRLSLYDLMNCSTPGFPVLHCLSEFA